MKKTIEVIFMALIAALMVLLWLLWTYDSYLYDKDLEAQHIKETGLSWADIEQGKSLHD